MVPLFDLWLAILVAAVFVFVASSVIHMCLPVHKGDFGKMPGEEAILAAMREQGVTRGEYMFPCAASMKDCSTPEMKAKFDRGPVGYVTVIPNGSFALGTSLGQWFAFSLLIGLFAGYAATLGLGHDASFWDVFRLTGAASFLGYAASSIQNSIWKGVSWTVTSKFIGDGLVYALATGAAFGWLWPSA